ncbi:hypothetical protein [Streptomyces sp. NPDC003247]
MKGVQLGVRSSELAGVAVQDRQAHADRGGDRLAAGVRGQGAGGGAG